MNRGLWRGFAPLALANWRELARDPKTFFLILLPPLCILGLFMIMPFLSNERSAIPVGVPAQADQAVSRTVDRLVLTRKFHFESVPVEVALQKQTQGETDVVVVLPASFALGPVLVDASEGSSVQVVAIKQAIEQAAVAAAVGTVTVQTRGGRYFDPLRYGAVGTLVYALASLAVFGIATPIVNMRQRGILRLLGTTPVTRLTFVLAQVPARLAVAATFTVIALVVVRVKWEVPFDGLLSGFATAMLGVWMLASFGYLIGSQAASTEAAYGVVTPVLPFVMMGSNIFFPTHIMPNFWFHLIPYFSPLSYLADALHRTLGYEGPPLAPLWVDYAVVLGTTALMTWLAVLRFRWDQGEEPSGKAQGGSPSVSKNTGTSV